METIKSLRQEQKAVKLILKYCRRRGYRVAFETLSRESGVRLEGPLQERLWEALVEDGDYEQAEKIFDEGLKNGELDHLISWEPCPSSATWTRICSHSTEVEDILWGGDSAPPSPAREHDLLFNDRDPRPDTSEGPADSAEAEYPNAASSTRPGPREGHQLFVDSTTGTLYLYGGWTGTIDMDDLWSFCTRTERWTLLCSHIWEEGGPSPRSWQNCVFDSANKRFYTLGGILEHFHGTPGFSKSGLYMYDAVTCKWSLLCSDTAAAGGPGLAFGQEMCIDPDTQTIYVFGGRILPINDLDVQYAGLYAYHITTNTWKLLLPDNHKLNAPQPRVFHSMLFHSGHRRLYILAGQRHKKQLLDLWWWNVDTGECQAICRGTTWPLPVTGFIQKATIDPNTDEIFVLSSGLIKDSEKWVHNTMWVFSLRRLVWKLIYRSDSGQTSEIAEPIEPSEDRLRFSHPLVYDPLTRVHYLFGGHPSIMGSPLGNLWVFDRKRGHLKRVVHMCRLVMRMEHYRELAARARRDPAQHAERALHYLRNDLRNALDHSERYQARLYRQLTTELFKTAEYEYLELEVQPLNPRGVRRLARRFDSVPDTGDLTYALGQVFGARPGVPQRPVPYEEMTDSDLPDTTDISTDDESTLDGSEMEALRERTNRIEIYDFICRYYRHSRTHPFTDLKDWISRARSGDPQWQSSEEMTNSDLSYIIDTSIDDDESLLFDSEIEWWWWK